MYLSNFLQFKAIKIAREGHGRDFLCHKKSLSDGAKSGRDCAGLASYLVYLCIGTTCTYYTVNSRHSSFRGAEVGLVEWSRFARKYQTRGEASHWLVGWCFIVLLYCMSLEATRWTPVLTMTLIAHSFHQPSTQPPPTNQPTTWWFRFILSLERGRRFEFQPIGSRATLISRLESN